MIVAEFTATGVVVATGEPYRLRYIAVLTIRAGRISCATATTGTRWPCGNCSARGAGMILVVRGTGTTGRLVAARLAAAGRRARVASRRRPPRASASVVRPQHATRRWTV
ncbi:nuclear transport factor 2 family protein [Micromonospora sp. BRA006-A]|nr:nuclear transport factor 2 family protein [Micromonospora sp. BRA006-A]